MRRLVTALSSYIVFCFGILAALLTVFALLDPKKDELNSWGFFGGTAIVSFVISWLLLKLSRKSE